MRRFLTLSFILAVLFVQPVLAFESPGRPDGYVSDFADMFSAETEASLETSLAAFEQESQHEIAVVTVETLGGEVVEEYAVRLFEEWGIGKQAADNGVLLLFGEQERRMRIEVGYGLEGVLTDAESHVIIQNIITPAFKAGEFDAGVLAGVEAIRKVASGEVIGEDLILPESSLLRDAWEELGTSLIFFVLMFISLITACIRWISKSKAIWHGALIGGWIGVCVMAYAQAQLNATIFVALAVGAFVGLSTDWLLSHHPAVHKWGKKVGKTKDGRDTFWFWGGGGGSGGGFGGFGGGSSGGGGASGSW